jgi:hypothetical protein
MALMLATSPTRAADEKQIKQMIQRGVAYLKQLQTENGSWPHLQSGMTSLAGLTLLECGVPSSDASVQSAAASVRKAAVTEDQTYSLALAILFLDRLGDDVDIALIEAMAARLLTGQFADGGWTYRSGSHLVEGQQTRLVAALRQGATGERRAPKATERRTGDKLSKAARGEIDAIVKGQHRQGAGPGQPAAVAAPQGVQPDNSNTQFALLGLWTARRYGVPIDEALAKAEDRFRKSQSLDGGWGYIVESTMDAKGAPSPALASSPTMVCAGLLGLAMSHVAASNRAEEGDRTDPPGRSAEPALDVTKDASIARALQALGTALVAPPAQNPAGARPGGARFRGGAQPPNGFQGPGGVLPPHAGGAPAGAGPAGGRRAFPAQNARLYYFLWSLERIAVAFGLERVGNKDWYKYGTDILLAFQEADGSWQGAHGSYGADTCFALLFLSRADLAKDLSASLRGKMKDTAELRAGVGFKGRESIKPIRSPFDDSLGSNHESSGKPPSSTRPQPPSTAGPVDPQISKLSAELVDAPAARWNTVLRKLRDAKGTEYTQALTYAIGQLDGDHKKAARQALAERLANLKTSSLLAYMDDDNPELRRGAALACAMKDDSSTIGKLIDLLADRERTVERAAYAALKELTKQDFGPLANGTAAEKAQAIKNWKVWWKKQAQK